MAAIRSVIVVCVLASVVCFVVQAEHQQSTEHENVRSPAVRYRQKRFIGGIAAAAVTIGGLIMSRKSAEAAARRHDASMQLQLEQLCTAICVTNWLPWGACSHPCGGGTQERRREAQTIGRCASLSDFQCPHALDEQQICNPDCAHGGLVRGPGECECTPAWTGQCCQTEVTCPYPGKPQNGQVSGTWPARYQSVATFTCNTGFALSGATETSCQTSGQWTNTAPSCRRITCTRPSASAHVVLMNVANTYHVNDELVYTCEDGYEMRGQGVRRCIPGDGTTGRWTRFSPTCRPVSCGDPGTPVHGQRSGSSVIFQAVVHFSCDIGYNLIGSDQLTCQSTGQWLGNVPECEQIVCDDPFEPRNGRLLIRSRVYGSSASFECDEGYRLDGPTSLLCTVNGTWSATEPTCQAAQCGEPAVPDNGAKDGSVYHYPHSITYYCFNGYTMLGTATIDCTAEGSWSAVPPVCEACPINTYMDEAEPGVCEPCPEFSHTTTEGTTNRQQCICDPGYTGAPGGPCTEIHCPTPTAPDQGYINGDYETTVGSVVRFACDDGYILSRGSGVRTCQTSGEWDGGAPQCTACGLHTYKDTAQSCLPCPIHSHTETTARMRDGCICDAGYQGPPGGPCLDVDECLPNEGLGPCSHVCENRNGGYQCACNIAGHAIKDDDIHNCIIERQCRNLTENDAPANGGLLCHWYVQENSQQCSVRCDPGYEFPSRTNDYEYCGESTNFTWSYKALQNDAVIEPCIEEFFPDFQMEASSLYFVNACHDLTEEEKQDAFAEFAARLEAKGVCKKNARQVCNINHMAVICGLSSTDGSRRRRDTEDPIDLAYGVKALKMNDRPIECDRICPFLRIPGRFCTQLCVPTYKRFLRAAVLYARRQLQVLHSGALLGELRFQTAQRTFRPASEGLHTGQVEGKCPQGMIVVNSNCVACPVGTFVNVDECTPCDAGYFQPLQGQLACVACPIGTISDSPGSAICHVCPRGTFGDRCTQSCQCVHGTCSPTDGTCSCPNGWEGPICDTDTDGCDQDDDVCPSGQQCSDIPAPGSGFRCAA